MLRVEARTYTVVSCYRIKKLTYNYFAPPRADLGSEFVVKAI